MYQEVTSGHQEASLGHQEVITVYQKVTSVYQEVTSVHQKLLRCIKKFFRRLRNGFGGVFLFIVVRQSCDPDEGVSALVEGIYKLLLFDMQFLFLNCV